MFHLEVKKLVLDTNYDNPSVLEGSRPTESDINDLIPQAPPMEDDVPEPPPMDVPETEKSASGSEILDDKSNT